MSYSVVVSLMRAFSLAVVEGNMPTSPQKELRCRKSLATDDREHLHSSVAACFLLISVLFHICNPVMVEAADLNTGSGLYKDGQKIISFDAMLSGVYRDDSTAAMKSVKGQALREYILGDRGESRRDAFLLAVHKLKTTLNTAQLSDQELAQQVLGIEYDLHRLFETRLRKLEDLEQSLLASGYGSEKISRHQQVLETFRSASEDLIQSLQQLKEAVDNGDVVATSSLLDKLRAHTGNHFRRFELEPRVQYPLLSTIDTKVAPVLSREGGGSETPERYPSHAMQNRLPDPVDLQPTADVQFTDDVVNKAAELGNSPADMFDFVRESFEFEPYLGSRKGSQQTLVHRKGNDYDQASLLIALLRVSGFPARYASGVVEMTVDQATNWLGISDPQTAANLLATAGFESVIYSSGGEPVAIRCRRVWVEAYLPYQNFRGAINDSTGSMWVPMDPAFKQYTYEVGIDLLSEINFDSEAFVRDYYLNGFHAESPLDDLRQLFTDSLAVYHPEAVYDDLITTRSVVKNLDGYIPGTLPYVLISKESDFAEIPSNKRYYIRFHLSGSGVELDYTISLPEIVEKQVTISYVGATAADQEIIDTAGGMFNIDLPYLVDLKPVLRIDGCEAAIGTGSVMMGTQQYSDMYFYPPSGAPNTIPMIANWIIAGNYQGIGVDSEDAIPAFFELPETTCDEGYLGQELHQTALYFLNSFDISGDELSDLLHQVVTNDVSEAIVENTISIDVDSLGFPISFEWTGLSIDADRKIMGPFSMDGSDRRCDYMRIAGTEGSIRENRVFEDRFDEEAVSTMKLLALASDSGIAICEITSSISHDCPGLNQYPVVVDAVNAALANGHHVIIPEEKLAYYDWMGTGFIDLDPSTCAAGYIISGEHNISGGSTVIQGWNYPIPDVRCMIPVGPITVTPISQSGLYCAESEQVWTFAVPSITYVNVNCDTLLTEYRQFPVSLSIKDLAQQFGVGEYTFTCGKDTSVCDCAAIDTTVTIVSVEYPDGMFALCAGQDRSMNVTVLPETVAVSFEVSEDTIASVSGSAPELTVHGLAYGTTQIVGFLGGDETAECGTKDIMVVEIELPDPDFVVCKGESKGMSMTVNPPGAPVFFESENDAVAKVSSVGAHFVMVEGIGNGSTRIWGNLMYDENASEAGYCTSNDVSVVDIEFPEDPILVCQGYDRVLTVSVTPEETPVTFSFNNPQLASVVSWDPPELIVHGDVNGHTSLIAEVGGEACYFKDFSVVTVEVTSVGFTHDHDITQWPTSGPRRKVYGRSWNWDDTPVWNPSQGINDPVCYTKSDNLIMFATFSIEPEFDEPVESGVWLRSVIDSYVVGEAFDLRISGNTITDKHDSDGDVDNITSGASVPGSDAVVTLNRQIEWKVSFDGGYSYCLVGNSGPHKFHFIEAEPLEEPLYDEGLNWACFYQTLIPGTQSPVAKICIGVDNTLTYNPGLQAMSQFTHPLKIFDGELAAQCQDHSRLMRCLTRSIGIDAIVRYLWGGRDVTRYGGYKRQTDDQWWLDEGFPTIQFLEAIHDEAPLNPHFSFHAIVLSGGFYFDPSYGTADISAIGEYQIGCLAKANFPYDTLQDDGTWIPAGTYPVDAEVQEDGAKPLRKDRVDYICSEIDTREQRDLLQSRFHASTHDTGPEKAVAREESLLAALNPDQLWSALDITVIETDVCRSGRMFLLSDSPDPVRVSKAMLGVYGNVDLATEGFRSEVAEIPGAPTTTGLLLGNEIRIWTGASGKSGTLIFRRVNVLVQLLWSGDLQNVVTFASRIDSLLIAEQSSMVGNGFHEPPHSLDTPTSVGGRAGSSIVILPRLTGFSASDTDVRAWASDLTVSCDVRDNEITLHVPENAESFSVSIIAVSNNCAISRKDVQIAVRD